MDLRKRLLAVLISLTMVLTYMPVMAFANTEPDQQGGTVKEETLKDEATANAPDAETPNTEAAEAEAPDAQIPDEEALDEQEPESVTPDAQTPEEAIPAEAPVLETPEPAAPDSEAQKADTPEAEAPEATDTADATLEDEELEIFVELEGESYNPGYPDDNDELFDEYIEGIFDLEEPEPPVLKRMTPLTGVNKAIHDKIKPEIAKVAKGTRTSTEFKVGVDDLNLEKTSWTAKELGVSAVYDNGKIPAEASNALKEKLNLNLKAIIDTLLAECPYELYWYNKTIVTNIKGVWMGVSLINGEYVLRITDGYIVYFPVAEDYAAGEYEVDTSRIDRVNHAVDKAAAIVASERNHSDLGKLLTYKEMICDLVSYDHEAADNDDTPYGDPWQLVSVFDEDPDTNVVCEGYSKAFQYLCKLTHFEGDISCITASGTMKGTSTNGLHMWNIVHMEDGKNYLVDVTNCDTGMIGSPNQLFLAGYNSGTLKSGYTFKCAYGNVTLSYSDRTLDAYYDEAAGDYADDLKISSTGYNLDMIYGTCGEEATFTLTDDGVMTITGRGAMKDFTEDFPSPWLGYDKTVKTVAVKKGITSIGMYAFYGGSDVTEVVLPDRLDSIGDFAFYGCSNLTEVPIPGSVSQIGESAFEGCDKITDVYYGGSEDDWAAIQIGDNNECLTGAAIHFGLTHEHQYDEGSVFEEPDCNHEGIRRSFCSICGLKKDVAIAKTEHVWGSKYSVDSPATFAKDGSESIHCTICGASKEGTSKVIPKVTASLSYTSTIFNGTARMPAVTVKSGTETLVNTLDYSVTYGGSRINAGTYTVTVTLKGGKYSGSKALTFTITPKAITPTVTLGYTACTYNGAVRAPAVTVKYGTTTLTKGLSYTVAYAAGRKNVGSYKVTITMKGNYSGTKAVYFKINPKGTTLLTPVAASKAITVKWNKQAAKMSLSTITGYQIQLATDSAFTKNVKTVSVAGYSKVSSKVTKLSGGKKYYIRIRTYKTISGTTYYSVWSAKKTITTKK